VSKQEAIASLVSELAAAQRRGYSADDLARLMSEKGIDINGPTLRNCLRRLRKKRRARDKAAAREPNATAAPGSSPITVGDKSVAGRASSDASKPPAPPIIRDAAVVKAAAPAPSPADDRPPHK
jgi:hypothetical protein